MTSFTNGVELTDPRCLLGKHEKAAPALGVALLPFSTLGLVVTNYALLLRDKMSRSPHTSLFLLSPHNPLGWARVGAPIEEMRIRSAALIFLARHKTAILGATLLAGVVRQLRGTGRQPVPSRIVAVGWQVPTCGVGVDRSSSVLEKSWRTRRPALRAMPGAAAIQLWRGSTPLIYQGHLDDVF